MKLNVNKKLLATFIAGSIAFSLTGCGITKNNNSEEIIPEKEKIEQIEFEKVNDLEFDQENNNVINNYDKANESKYIYLVTTNIPDNAYLTFQGDLEKPLSKYQNKKENNYLIPSNDFTINFEDDNETYSYTIQAQTGTTVYLTNGYNKDKESVLYVEKGEYLKEKDLKQVLNESNINLDDIINDNNVKTNLFKITNLTFKDNIISYQRDAIYLNDILLYEEINDNDNYKYYSPFKRGDGINKLELQDYNTMKLTYDNKYINNYEVIEHMENNANYFLNTMNQTTDVNYFTEGYVNLAELINEETAINEHIETYYQGHEKRCIRYSYNINGSPLLEFGQVNYTNDYYVEDYNGNINLNPEKENQKVL